MTQTESTTENAGSPPILAGLVAEFDGPDALRAAAEGMRRSGYRRFDAHSPYPVHGLDRAMGIRPTLLPWLVLGAGLAGAAAALLLQWWTNAVDYPVITSAKPRFSLPADIPVVFELIVLFSALAAFVGCLALNRLPQFWHPVFTARRFRRASTDGFFLSVEAADARFDPSATGALLELLGARAIEPCLAPADGRRIPRALYRLAIIALALAVLPPLWIARVRHTKSERPRIHPIQDMDFQPRYQSQAASPLFADGRAMRPALPGTIADDQLDADEHLHRGRVGNAWAVTFPIPITRENLNRGRRRYNIFCAPCHGLTGGLAPDDLKRPGRPDKLLYGLVALRAAERIEGEQPGYTGWVMPRSLHEPSVVGQPAGQLFHTISQGLNTMPAYGAQIPAEDRWRILLYVRALERSQNARLEDVLEDRRADLK
jgi:mono/diheme cytochrome c family protein